MVLICIGLAIQCKIPIGLPTGKPVEQTSLRSTPQGLLDQLIESYETKSIELFIDLLPLDGSFQFFIAPDFFDDYLAQYRNLKEARDERMQFIGQSEYYYYWTQEDEVGSHTHLFTQAKSIEFKDPPALESIRKFTDNGDSLAELLITGGSLEISRDLDIYTTEILTVSITQQVFLIEKDMDGLWVIRKWYDFSKETE